MSDGIKRWQNIQSDCVSSDGSEHVIVNVVPMFGDEHELSPSCWCNPKHDAEEWHVLIHQHNFKLVGGSDANR